MTRSFLFGGTSSSQSQNKYLVEFRAGKMTMKDNKVSADKRKGLVYVYQADDSLMHFCWKDRTSGAVEDDLIIFPDDVIFKRVFECTTGRVFVLKFKSSSRRCFYWMQEPKTDKDNDYCIKVNQYLNNPPAAGSSRGGGSSSLGGSSTPSHGGGGLQSELSSLGDSDLQNLLNNMSQQQLIQLLGGVGGVGGMPSLSTLLGASRPSSGQSNSSSASETPARTTSDATPPSRTSTQSSTPRTTQAASVTSTPTPTPAPVSAPAPAASTTPSSASSIQLSDLQNILSGLSVPAQGESSASKPSVDLSSAITAEALQPLFNNKELMDRVKAFLPPPNETNPTGIETDRLRSTVQSPQFQQALGMFSYALQSGQLGPLMNQFGMSADVIAAANAGDMDAFVRALQKSKESQTGGSKEDKKDQDKDEDMNVD